MPLKTYLIGLAGALALTASPAAIAAAQQAPALPLVMAQAAPAPAEANPDDALAKRRQKLQEMRDARQAEQGGEPDTAKPRKPRKPQDAAEPQQADQGAQPAETPAKPRKPRKPQDATEAPAPQPADQGGEPDTAKPRKPRKPQDAAEAPAPQPVDQGAQPAETPAKPRKPRKPQDAAETPAQPVDQGAQPAETPVKPRKPRQPDETAQPASPPPVDQGANPPAETPVKPRKPRQPDEAAQPQPPQPLDQGDNQPGKPRRKPDQAGAPDQPQPGGPPSPRPGDQARPETKPAPVEQAQPETPPAPAAGGVDVLGDNRPLDQLTDAELRARLQAARARANDKSLPAQTRAQLRETIKASGQEILARRARRVNGQQPDQAGQVPTPGLPKPGLPIPGTPPVVAEPAPGQPPAGQPNPVVTNPRVDPNAERQAAALLVDNAPATGLSNQALRGRLSLYRDALSAGNLSPETQRRLRQRLSADSQTLRLRVAEQETAVPGQPNPPQGAGRPPRMPPPLVVLQPTLQDIPGIIADRRPPAGLDERTLNRRILVYRDAVNDPRYGDADRAYFQRYLLADREELRRRMMEDRRQRLDDLRWARDNRQLDVDIDVDLRPPMPSRPPIQTIWAAEVDDSAIEEQLIARPLRPLPQRYPRQVLMAQPETVLTRPEIRQSIPSVELDTIHFGFNQAVVSEEEIANLDRIGRILEKIVAAHPNEVFLIEGHTDAVGSDASNLVLSRQRAEAVKQALTEYYQISPDNLTTAGLGARYLKVQTPDPEQENRRVTIRRITALVQN
ncbi:OmpA family protein [Labrys wisconsinensis]|uniref:Outer membrane protein OmpA-like peptidoglycan-associated protein n=1 Tax=Labrys wisconsinensis TaxID=425677 RepID=A0ABU0JE32_9HYPH|nr:OmpA family protein [Labrys wisconsinensis]MDQ0472537.1 outer membrane protein OmpA-like peptidoglycan-associated protein [Labrys wisconsinensis]